VSIADQYDLSNAASTLAIANTPLFLVQKLQEDPVVRTISTQMTGDEILSELQSTVQKKPETLRESVVPYVLLVALYHNSQAAYLRKATRIQPSYEDQWFVYVRNVLIETYQPTSRQVLELRTGPMFSTRSSSASARHTILANDPTNVL